MKQQTEGEIARTLRALREVEIPAGMERRILDAAQKRMSVPAAGRPRRLRPRLAAAWSIGAASVATVLVVVFVMLTVTHQRPAPVLSGNKPEQGALHASSTAGEVRADAGVSTQREVEVAEKKPHAERRSGRAVQATRTPAAAALAESYPAPPLPLTEQEKLLVRLVHKGDPVQFAMLDPVVRATREARDRADFQRFFEPQTTGETK